MRGLQDGREGSALRRRSLCSGVVGRSPEPSFSQRGGRFALTLLARRFEDDLLHSFTIYIYTLLFVFMYW